MTEPTPNLPLLRKVVDHIDAQPLGWMQADWLTDVKVKIAYLEAEVERRRSLGYSDLYTRRLEDELNSYRQARDADCGTAGCIAGWTVQMSFNKDKFTVLIDGSMDFKFGNLIIEDEAAELLGLTDYETRHLFEAFNTREDIQRICEEIAARAGEKF